MVKDYSISIPAPNEKIQMWRIDAVLGYDFLTGGSLGYGVECLLPELAIMDTPLTFIIM
jgi:hypothetical protein